MTASEQTPTATASGSEQLLSFQRRLIAEMVGGGSLLATLTAVCDQLELIHEDAWALVMLLDRSAGVLRFAAGPSIPDEYVVAVDGLVIGRGFNVLGEAVMRGEISVVNDTRTDELARQTLGILEGSEIRSAIICPLRHAQGPALGVLAIYRHRPHTPAVEEIETAAALANLATLAVESARLHATEDVPGGIDTATGLATRMQFLELVNARVREPENQVAVLALGVDRFKPILDHLSKLAGDRVLGEVARRLRGAAGDEALVGRYAEDEFTVMVAAANERTALRVADRLLGAFDEPVIVEGGEFFVTATIGIAHSNGETDAYGLIGDAITAMHAARSEGLGRRRTYDAGLHARVAERISREAQLRHAVARGEFVLHYQPCLDLRTRRFTRVEALARWNHPERGLVGPEEFIPLAEETGLIVPLGVRIMLLAVEQARRWRERLPDVRLAVNVSVMQLANPTFADELLAMLARAQLPTEALILEITESALMQEPEMMQRSLERLRQAGMPVALDDFGTGHSSIARLRELPVRTLKVDRRLTADICRDPAARTVASAIAAIARAHNLIAVAEGLEDADSLALVTQLGYAYGQGHYLARPDTVGATEALLCGPVPAHLSS